MNEVGFNKQFADLKLRYGVLKEVVANKLQRLQTLLHTVGPNIKVRYMMFIGRLEYTVYGLKVELARWKRRLSLRQAAINRGETPDLKAIEAAIREEFAKYMKEIMRMTAELRDAEESYAAAHLSDKEQTEVRYAYLRAVKLLHPDLNHDLPEAARRLWDDIQAAYANHDWDAVVKLAALADAVVGGERDFMSEQDPAAALRAECERLEARGRELDEEAERVQREVPFTYRDILDDREEVARRQNELKMDIAKLKAETRKCEEVWKNG